VEAATADLDGMVGAETSSLEGVMVEIRVEATDTVAVHSLLRRLSAMFGRSAVSFDGARSEVRVCSEWQSRAVVQVVDAVEDWLGESGANSAQLWMGDRSYTVFGPAPVTSPI
jgi:hypothetical protein